MNNYGDVYDKLLCGCKRMVQHTLSSGITVPIGILKVLEPISPPSSLETPSVDELSGEETADPESNEGDAS